MHQRLVFILILFPFQLLLAQQVDSLLQGLSTSNTQNEKLHYLTELCQELKYSHIDSAETFALQGLELATQLRDEKEIAIAHNNLGNIESILGNWKESAMHYATGLEIGERIQDSSVQALILNNYGIVYQETGQYPKAIELYLRSYEMRKKRNEHAKMAVCLNNIGSIYFEMKKPAEALSYFKQALAAHQKAGNQYAVPSSLGNIGTAFIELDQPDSALRYHHRALQVTRELGDLRSEAYSLSYLGSLLADKNLYDSALYYYDLAVTIRRNIQDNMGLLENWLQRATVYRMMDNLATEKNYLDSAYVMADSLELTYELDYVLKDLAELHAKQGNYENALQYAMDRDSVKNVVATEGRAQAIGQLEARFELELAAEQKLEKDKQFAELQSAKALRRNLIQYAVITITILILAGLALMTGKIRIHDTVSEALVFLVFLVLFEFAILLTEPVVEKLTQGDPLQKLGINAVLAIVIFPAHDFLEKWFKKRLKPGA